MYLVDAKAKDEMDEHIESKTGETEPEEAALTSTPDTCHKEQYHQSLNPITQYPVVFHKNNRRWKGWTARTAERRQRERRKRLADVKRRGLRR